MNRRRTVKVLALLAVLAGVTVVTAGVVAIPATPAYAHAQLVGTTPANGARLDTAPAEIVLRFSERVMLVRDGIRLLDAAGSARPTGPARIDEAGREAILPVPAGLANGAYVVSWRVVSADSHPIHGAFTFGVGDVQVTPLPDAGARVSADPGLSTMHGLLRWLGYAGLALLLGGALFLFVCWPAGWVPRRTRRILLAGWITTALSAVGLLLIQGPYASGGTLRSAADPDLLGATLRTDFGRFISIRLQLLALAGVLLMFLFRRSERPRWTVWAAAALGAALPATWIGTGHANADANPAVWLSDAVHLAAMAAWFGGLVLLVTTVLSRTAARPVHEVSLAVTRFSGVAMACVGLLVVTGTYQAWRGVGSFGALSGSDYGRLLIFKIALVGVLLWIGWMSRALVQRHYRAALSTMDDVEALAAELAMAGGSGRLPRGPSRSHRRSGRAALERAIVARKRLRWTVGIEVAIGVAVLAITSLLVATPPGSRPAAAGPAAAGSVAPPSASTRPEVVAAQLSLDGGGRVYIQLDPARVGDSTLLIAVLDSASKPWDVPEVRATLSLSAQGIGPLPVTLRKVRPGDYTSDGLTIPMAGTWQLQIKVRTSEIDQITLAATLPVS